MAQYPINPQICLKCMYKNKSLKSMRYMPPDGTCSYLAMMGHCKPSGSIYDNCLAYEPIDERTRDKLMKKASRPKVVRSKDYQIKKKGDRNAKSEK